MATKTIKIEVSAYKGSKLTRACVVKPNGTEARCAVAKGLRKAVTKLFRR